MMPPLIFDRVGKHYGDIAALTDVDLEVAAGDRVALLGRNGAGKTTLLRIALGLARPDSGLCRLFGRPPDDRVVRRSIGYAPQANTVPEQQRVRDLIRFVCDLKNAARPDDLIDRLEVASMMNASAGGLSLGERRRLTVLLALIGAPKLLVLDEPTVNLDGQSRLAVWDVISDFCGDGGTLILASHDFREVARLTERVVVLAAGRVRADTTVEQVSRSTGLTAIEVPRTTDPGLADVSYVVHQPDRTVLLTRRPEATLEQVATLPGAAPAVQRRPTVEEVCLALGGQRG